MFKCLNKIVLVVMNSSVRLVGAHEMNCGELSFFGLVPPPTPGGALATPVIRDSGCVA